MNPIILNINSGLALFYGIAFLAILAWVFWPTKGLIAYLKRIKKNSKRVQLEDALKYLFDCEYNNNLCNMNSIAGNLNISNDNASQLVERLLSMGLIAINDQNIELTDTGRSYSLRVIRVHRIWERYLADETSVAQADWHNEADRIEHFASQDETEKLAALMGNPVFDPHGDPIPSVDGELPEQKGISLNHLKEGETGRIIHIEDEPRSVYEQLVVQGLYPGMQVYVTDVDTGKITFVANGDECSLTPFFASQITVEKISGKVPVAPKFELLSSLKIGDKAEIAAISPNCRGQQRRRLMDLGVVPGSLVTSEIRSPSGDPVGYRVMGTTIGIRKTQADLIFIHKKNDNTNE
jgi:DtxR family transcriptional regulator, Mn-dependent transcriptional regulator